MSHPSNLALERLWADDLPHPVRDETQRHVEQCNDCKRFVSELHSEHQALMIRMPPGRVVAVTTASASKTHRFGVFLGRFGVALATALAVVTVVVVKKGAADPDVLFKGPGLAVHALRNGQTKVLRGGDGIQAGDRLRVVLTLSEPAYVQGWYIDANETLAPLFPEPVWVERGSNPLPGSVEVEAPCADLTLVIGSHVSVSQLPSGESVLRELLSGEVPSGSTIVRMRCQ